MRDWVRKFIREMNELSNSGKFIVGLTGLIGSGKSTALGMFKECGAFVISADEIVDQLLTSQQYYSIILTRYPEVGDPHNKIDRKALARVIFSNKRAKRFIEDVIHPKVASHIVEEIKKTATEAVVVEVPLLFEVGIESAFDLTVCVVAQESKIIYRLRKRGLGMKDIRVRMNNQISHIFKVNMSDVVVVNNDSIEDLRERIHNISLALGILK